MEESDSKVCPNCKREIPTVNFTIHTVHCARNIKVCPVCKEPVPQNELQEHHDKLHKLMPCKQCGESVCGTDLEDHIRDSCGHTIKSCRYCELELPRHELPAHEGYCGVRTEQCPECKEWVMIKYRQLHLDSNHGFLRLDDDPVPQPKKVPPKTSANPIRDMLASTSNGLRNVPLNGLRPAAEAPRDSTRLLGNPGSSFVKNTEAPRTETRLLGNASGSVLARNGIGGGSSGGASSSAGIGGSGVRNGTANDGRNFDKHEMLKQVKRFSISENIQQRSLPHGADRIKTFFAKQSNSNIRVARVDHGALNNDPTHEAPLNNWRRETNLIDFDDLPSAKCDSKRTVTTDDIGALKAVNPSFGAARARDQEPLTTVNINRTLGASRMDNQALNTVNRYPNLGVATANHSALNSPRREKNLIDFDDLTSAKCDSKRTVSSVDILTAVNPSFEAARVDYAPFRIVNRDSISEVIQQFRRNEGVTATSSSGVVRHTPNANGVPGGSGEVRRTLAKRSNDQPQINSSVSSVNKVHKDMATSRGAVKKRPAPKPPVDRKRDLQYYSALQRQQAEERQRQELSAYNASVGLPPVLSAAAKLDKLRKMDALHNREVEDNDYKNRLQGRVWMNSTDASTSAGHRLGSNSPEDPNVRNELRNLKPMTPAEFIARFEQLQLREVDGAQPAAKGDRFSEIKSSLRELRRGLNEVTAPYNSNSTNNHNDRHRRRSASSSPVEELAGDLEVALPCEFCGALVPALDLVQHQTGCRPDLTQLRPRGRSPSAAPPAAPPALPADPYENPVIPCEFCTESLPVYLISEHQERCRRDPDLLFPD